MSKRNRSKQTKNVNMKIRQAVIDNKTAVDIVIPVYRRFDILFKCLEVLPKAISSTYNLILVDNGSPKEEADDFYSKIPHSPNTIIIRNKENLGFPKACNMGARRKNSPLIFFLNSDVILYPNSLDKLIETINKPEKVETAIVGMKLIFPPDGCADLNPNIRPAGKLQHIGLETNIRGEFIHIFVGWDADHPKVNAVKNPYAVTGAAFLIKRIVWNKIGGFYEGYGMGTWEDIDACLSARDLGYNVLVNPEAVGIHYTGATAEGYEIPYALDFNKLIFLQRWATRTNYTESQSW